MLKVIVPHITIFQLLHHSLQLVVFKHLCIEISKILGCVSMIFIFVYNVTNTQSHPFMNILPFMVVACRVTSRNYNYPWVRRVAMASALSVESNI